MVKANTSVLRRTGERPARVGEVRTSTIAPTRPEYPEPSSSSYRPGTRTPPIAAAPETVAPDEGTGSFPSTAWERITMAGARSRIVRVGSSITNGPWPRNTSGSRGYPIGNLSQPPDPPRAHAPPTDHAEQFKEQGDDQPDGEILISQPPRSFRPAVGER